MNDPNNTTQPNEAATDQASMAPQRMSEVLPLIAQMLRSHGVLRVHARYDGKEIRFIFTGVDKHPLPKYTAVETALAITNALKVILERRYPGATKAEGVSGYFEWDLVADTLRHEHVVTVTHHGI